MPPQSVQKPSEQTTPIFWQQRAIAAVATIHLMGEFLCKKGLFGEYQEWLAHRIRAKEKAARE